MSRVTIAAAVMALIAFLSGCTKPADEPPRAATNVFAVGECVAIPSGSPLTKDSLHATKVSCSVDPSYTVGAVADGAGVCPSPEYQHLPGQLADASTAKL